MTKEQAIQKAQLAIDALIDLADEGFASDDLSRTLDSVNRLISSIQLEWKDDAYIDEMVSRHERKTDCP